MVPQTIAQVMSQQFDCKGTGPDHLVHEMILLFCYGTHDATDDVYELLDAELTLN